ncbi:MAG: hypothetical protein RI907_2130 [Pseudomonadota bacterium]|jgi:membrane protein YqaA with SNARE-associated domain
MNKRALFEHFLRHSPAWCWAWAVVEGGLWFIVPDVGISIVAVPSLARALWCSLWAVAGAMVGGSLMYAWGQASPDVALQALLQVPAVYPAMVQGVTEALQREGLSAMIWGPAKGIPYKIYAEQAGSMGLPYWQFLWLTVPARIVRFIVTCLGFHFVGKGVARVLGARALPWVWALFWVGNYTVYWGLHLGR